MAQQSQNDPGKIAANIGIDPSKYPATQAPRTSPPLRYAPSFKEATAPARSLQEWRPGAEPQLS
jgi:hypothetical protein